MKKEAALENLMNLKDIPVKNFEKEIRRILGDRIWWSNTPSEEKDGDTYRRVNYRCGRDTENHMYCLNLNMDLREGTVSVTDGFIAEV